MRPKFELVLVEWADSRQPTTAWEMVVGMPERDYCACVSVGWLLRDDKKVKVLAANVADIGNEMQAVGILVIPTACVLRMKLLREATFAGRAVSARNRRQTSRP